MYCDHCLQNSSFNQSLAKHRRHIGGGCGTLMNDAEFGMLNPSSSCSGKVLCVELRHRCCQGPPPVARSEVLNQLSKGGERAACDKEYEIGHAATLIWTSGATSRSSGEYNRRRRRPPKPSRATAVTKCQLQPPICTASVVKQRQLQGRSWSYTEEFDTDAHQPPELMLDGRVRVNGSLEMRLKARQRRRLLRMKPGSAPRSMSSSNPPMSL